MDEDIDVKGFFSKLKPMVRKTLYYWFMGTMLVLLLILVYYKGMSAQCQDLGMNLYWADTERGFECKKPGYEIYYVVKDDQYTQENIFPIPIIPEGEL